MSAQVLQYFLAGFAPLQSAITHVLYYLSKYPLYQDIIYNEIESNKQELGKCQILNAFINESMRLSPPIIFVEHMLIENIDYPGKILNTSYLSFKPCSSIHLILCDFSNFKLNFSQLFQ